MKRADAIGSTSGDTFAPRQPALTSYFYFWRFS
jgi:hypothetical protein